MRTDLDLRLISLEAAKLSDPRNLLTEAQYVFEWLKAGQPVHDEVSAASDRMAERLSKLDELMDHCLRLKLPVQYAKYKAEWDGILAVLQAIATDGQPATQTLCDRGLESLTRDGYDFAADFASSVKGDEAATERLARHGVHVFKAELTTVGQVPNAIAEFLARRRHEVSQDAAPQVAAEQPAPKRVPKVGDVVVSDGKEFLVYVVYDDSKNFRGILVCGVSRLVPDQTNYFDHRMQDQDRGWSFKN